MKRYYLYMHCLDTPAETPFYIGKGCGLRAFSFERRSHRHQEMLDSIGLDNVVVKIYPCVSEEAAYAREEKLVTQYRTQGVDLCNELPGGPIRCTVTGVSVDLW